MAFMAAALLASCSDSDEDYSGDFGQIKVPDTRQLEQTVTADDTQAARGVTFTTEGAWTSTIAEKTRAEAPDWIGISPNHGDAAGSYTLKITLESNTSEASRSATIVITCGTSKIEINVTQEGSDDPIEPMPANRIMRIDSHRQTIQNSGNSELERWTSTSHFAYDDAGRLTSYEWDDTPENTADVMDEVLRISYPDAKTLKLSKRDRTPSRSTMQGAPSPPATTTVSNAGLSPTTATAAAKSAPTRATKPTTTRARSAAGAATTSPVSTSTKARKSISATNSNTTPTCPTRPQCATSTSMRSCSTYAPTSRTPTSPWGQYSPESGGWANAAPI